MTESKHLLTITLPFHGLCWCLEKSFREPGYTFSSLLLGLNNDTYSDHNECNDDQADDNAIGVTIPQWSISFGKININNAPIFRCFFRLLDHVCKVVTVALDVINAMSVFISQRMVGALNVIDLQIDNNAKACLYQVGTDIQFRVSDHIFKDQRMAIIISLDFKVGSHHQRQVTDKSPLLFWCKLVLRNRKNNVKTSGDDFVTFS